MCLLEILIQNKPIGPKKQNHTGKCGIFENFSEKKIIETQETHVGNTFFSLFRAVQNIFENTWTSTSFLFQRAQKWVGHEKYTLESGFWVLIPNNQRFSRILCIVIRIGSFRRRE